MADIDVSAIAWSFSVKHVTEGCQYFESARASSLAARESWLTPY